MSLHEHAIRCNDPEEARGKYQIYPRRNQRMINVFTATYTHEGIKIIADCLTRQTIKDFNWIVVDKHYDLKWFVENIMPYGLDVIYVPEKTRYPEKISGWNKARNTGKMYFDAQLIVEFEDHIWFAPDCLERFWKVYDQCPNSICSAAFSICTYDSMQKTFGKELVTDDDLEVFDHTIRPRDKGIITSMILPYVVLGNQYVGFEGNVCAYPHSLVRNTGVWDENMDDSHGFNNYQIAIEAMLLDYRIFIDTNVKYYHFEHKDAGSEAWDWSCRDCRNNEDYLKKKYQNKIFTWIFAGNNKTQPMVVEI